MFGGRLIGIDAPFEALDAFQRERVAALGASFTGFLSIFNVAGRFFWSALSDRIGRRAVYAIIFLAGAALYYAVPTLGHAGDVGLFCAAMAVILTMYGGGFAAIPAYLADLFGTGFVGAIHGRLLTAWSVAGILGPVIVNSLAVAQLRAGLPAARAYDRTMVILAALLLVGFVCNLLVRPIAAAAHDA